MTDIEHYRPGFEAWARSKRLGIEREGDGYYWPATDDAWEIWLASKREASTESAGTLTDEAKDAALRDALNTTLWLYRRLPHAYGKPPFVDAAILAIAERLGMDDVPESIKERAELLAHTKSQEK